MKKYRKILTILIISCCAVFSVIGIISVIMVTTSNIYIEGKSKELQSNIDQSYIFNNRKILSVKNNVVNYDVLDGSYFNISPACDKNKAFKVRLKDTITTEPFIYNDLNNIIAISDIEGNFKVFTSFLISNKIIDENFNWIFGNGHLVCNGDFFDRGNDVTATLWLIYKLEEEAEAQGGKVHFIIGNHEEMNLRGNTNSTHRKYTTLAKNIGIPYKEMYGKNTELGRWLRSKNSMEIINKTIFTHAGVSPFVIEKKYTLTEINNLTQDYIGNDHNYIDFLNSRAGFLFSRKGPMWYRGYFGDYKDYYKATTQADIEAVLHYFEANRIVVGHTIVDQVTPMYNNKVIAIDVMSANDPRKKDDDEMAVSCEGLFIENGNFYRALFNGKKELMFTQND